MLPLGPVGAIAVCVAIWSVLVAAALWGAARLSRRATVAAAIVLAVVGVAVAAALIGMGFSAGGRASDTVLRTAIAGSGLSLAMQAVLTMLIVRARR